MLKKFGKHSLVGSILIITDDALRIKHNVLKKHVH